jgi:hypothetical protein
VAEQGKLNAEVAELHQGAATQWWPEVAGICKAGNWTEDRGHAKAGSPKPHHGLGLEREIASAVAKEWVHNLREKVHHVAG